MKFVNKSSRAIAIRLWALSCCIFLNFTANAQKSGPLAPEELKRMSLEELMNLEVTSVSRRPEKLTEAASAIQVITGEDIRRSGATNLPEALRLVTNLQVAQLNSYATIISARGFNSLFSNKLLVMIDGRTVYSPLFAGVFWDAQNILLEEIDRIEVISGPGGTLWEANAVNGIINIITKKAQESQGIYATVAGGSFLRDNVAVRYGGKAGKNVYFKIYGQHTDKGNTFGVDGSESPDKWGITHGGFRLDWTPSDEDVVMFQGNLYGGREQTMPRETELDGQNILGRWIHTFTDNTRLQVNAYIDRNWRRMPTISFEADTYDLDVHYSFPLGKAHNLLVGAGYRLMVHKTENFTTSAGILPNRRDMNLFNGFIQDEISIVPDHLKLTIGSKLLHNAFTGFEVQPGVRLNWMPDENHTIWSAVSRAVRIPSRIDVDYYIPTTPVEEGQPSVAGGPNFVSEKVVAYELGYRVRPGDNLSIATSAFYNSYDDLYSVEALPGTRTFQIQNGTIGTSWGLEFAGTYQPLETWRLRGGYTFFDKDLGSKPGHTFDPSTLGYDAQNQFMLHSIHDLPGNFQLDLIGRYMDRLSGKVPDYFTFDMRLAWVFKQWEIAAIGQNLWEDGHREWSNEIPRGIFGKLTWRFNR